MSLNRFRLLAASGLAASLAGCAPSVAIPDAEVRPISGTALLADGSPAKFVKLEFNPQFRGGTRADATTDGAGRFEPKTNLTPGLAEGAYRVSATATPKTGARLDAAISSEYASPLMVTVKAGEPLAVTLKAP